MDSERYRKIQYLADCSYLPGSWEKRFARDMSRLEADAEITLRQAFAIDRQYYRYRKQIEAMPGNDKPDFIKPGDVNELLDSDPYITGFDPIARPGVRERNKMQKHAAIQEKLAKWNKNASG